MVCDVFNARLGSVIPTCGDLEHPEHPESVRGLARSRRAMIVYFNNMLIGGRM